MSQHFSPFPPPRKPREDKSLPGKLAGFFAGRRWSLGLVAFGLISLILLPLVVLRGSCRAAQPNSAEAAAQNLDALRDATHDKYQPPTDERLAAFEKQAPNSRLAALARFARARLRLAAGDANGAAALLDTDLFSRYTDIADYALYVRGKAFAQVGKNVEARKLFDQLISNYPQSLIVREATLGKARTLIAENNFAAVPPVLQALADKNEAAALWLSARAYAQTGDAAKANALYRRVYFYSPASDEAEFARAQLTGEATDVNAAAQNANAANGNTANASRRTSSAKPTPVPAATAEEAYARADQLFAARRWADALASYAEAYNRFPQGATPQATLRRGTAAANLKRTADAAGAFNSIPTGAGELRAEALAALAAAYANTKQWAQARATVEQLRREFPQSDFTVRAMAGVGIAARDAGNKNDALAIFRDVVNFYPQRAESATPQFEIAWAQHDAKNYSESARLLLEHLAFYADKNSDNRGRAGYWAARDAERSGNPRDARALYDALLTRYDANWYGFLARQRVAALPAVNRAAIDALPPDAPLRRAVANLQDVDVAEETVGREGDVPLARSEQLNVIGADEDAQAELAALAKQHPASPRVNLALARIYRSNYENVNALLALRRSFPDYSQMKPEEMTREEWDVFYPLHNWADIKQWSRARGLDAKQVAGLIRQESVFNPRAKSGAQAYGLMQLLIPTARSMAARDGASASIGGEDLFQPALNIRLGTLYLKQQLDKFGRIEYAAAAYNAGPGRIPGWRASLPPDMDEWVEAIPFKETRGYVQGVTRNTLQYARLYDDNGNFVAAVGRNAGGRGGASNSNAPNGNVRPRRLSGNEREE